MPRKFVVEEQSLTRNNMEKGNVPKVRTSTFRAKILNFAREKKIAKTWNVLLVLNMFQLLNDVYIIFLACLQPLQTLFYVRNPLMSELRAVNYFIYNFGTG